MNNDSHGFRTARHAEPHDTASHNATRIGQDLANNESNQARAISTAMCPRASASQKYVSHGLPHLATRQPTLTHCRRMSATAVWCSAMPAPDPDSGLHHQV
eukprot:CAMPEP_0204201734 /NCGR_PEP_ID=MMETSP0361-20130328/67695_1 /ASSEMBLY_ACC=CAM_ASM_000343 /TAXON_ID=268821 /ORGANISM="Scrippsiella Hangoei, Strain SHTV-5" /LENGTH=100 /DNA_ID=CAMNT_0051164417 /DNA_START=38 /DNA_END=337 /DNA_ORIENTATION=-